MGLIQPLMRFKASIFILVIGRLQPAIKVDPVSCCSARIMDGTRASLRYAGCSFCHRQQAVGPNGTRQGSRTPNLL